MKSASYTFNGVQTSPFQQAYILFNDVSDAQNAIKKFDQSNMFGSKPLNVDFWMSREDINQQKEQKNRQMLEMLTKKEFANMAGNPFAMALGEALMPQGGFNQNNQYNNMQQNDRSYQGQR